MYFKFICFVYKTGSLYHSSAYGCQYVLYKVIHRFFYILWIKLFRLKAVTFFKHLVVERHKLATPTKPIRRHKKY